MAPKPEALPATPSIEPTPATSSCAPKMSRPVPPKSRPRPPKSVPRPATSPATPPTSKTPARSPLLPRLESTPPRLERAPAAPAVLAVLPDAPVKLDNALAGVEATVEASPAAPPIADDDPGVDSPWRAWVTEDISCVDIVGALLLSVWAIAPAWLTSPLGLVVWGGDAKVEKADAEAEVAA